MIVQKITQPKDSMTILDEKTREVLGFLSPKIKATCSCIEIPYKLEKSRKIKLFSLRKMSAFPPTDSENIYLANRKQFNEFTLCANQQETL